MEVAKADHEELQNLIENAPRTTGIPVVESSLISFVSYSSSSASP
jgi:hypothetical protein